MDARRPIKPIISDPLIIPRVKQVNSADPMRIRIVFLCAENTSQFFLLHRLHGFVCLCMCVFYAFYSDTSAIQSNFIEVMIVIFNNVNALKTPTSGLRNTIVLLLQTI